jgi:hypothetical protein
MRRAARVDGNHGEIIDTLRKAGCTVLDMSRLGNGAPDIALGYGGLTMMAEIKDGSKSPSKRRLTPDEQKWADMWTGGCALILSPSDALEAANTLRRWAMMLRTMPQEQSGYESGAD